MAKPMSDEHLAQIVALLAKPYPEIAAKPSALSLMIATGRELLAEVEQLRDGLRVLAKMPDGQEVVSAEDLRVSGDGSHVVHGPTFTAVHEDDLTARLERLLA